MASDGNSNCRKYLTLESKVQLIQAAESSNTSHRMLALTFGCGRTTVGTVLRTKDDILRRWEELQTSFSCSKTCEEDKKDQNLPEDREMTIDSMLDQTLSIKGGAESQKMNNSLKDFSRRDVFCLSSTKIFYRALPDRFVMTTSKLKTVDMMMMCLLVNAEGTFEKPAVVSRSHWDASQEYLESSSVQWFQSDRVHMTRDILEIILERFNQKLKAENRTVILHVFDMMFYRDGNKHFSNISILNTCAPIMDDVFRELRCHYRIGFLDRVQEVAHENDDLSLEDVVERITPFEATSIILQALSKMRPENVSRTFRKRRLITTSKDECDEDPTCLEDLERTLREISEKLNLTTGYSAEEYSRIDTDQELCMKWTCLMNGLDERWRRCYSAPVKTLDDAIKRLQEVENFCKKRRNSKIDKGFKQLKKRIKDEMEKCKKKKK